MKQKPKRLAGIFFALLVFATIFIGATSPALASSASKQETELKQQYLARLAWRIAFTDTDACIDLSGGDDSADGAKMIKEDMRKYPRNNDLNHWYSDTREVGRVGAFLFGKTIDGQDHEIDCNSKNDMDPVLKALGFNRGIIDFNNFLFNCDEAFTDTGVFNFDREYCPLKDEFMYQNGKKVPSNAKPDEATDILSGDKRMAKILTSLEKRVEDKLFNGDPDNKIDITKPAYTSAEKYWYDLTVLESRDYNGQYACKPTYYTKAEQGKFNAAENTTDFSDGSVRKEYSPPIKKVDDTGKITEYPYVTFNIPKDRTIEGLDRNMVDKIGATCDELVQSLSSLAPAYQKDFINHIKTDNPGNPCNDKTGNDFIDCAATNKIDTARQDAPSNDSTGDVELQCTVSKNALSWIMCPLIEGFNKSIEALDGQINSMLTINTEAYFHGAEDGSNDTAVGFRNVWVKTRSLAISFLVIIGLIMVIGTALGTGFFDAYTVKKLFPRIVVAVVLISISWPLVVFMIDASNSLGLGIRILIQSPFKSAFDQPVTVGGGQVSVGAIGVVVLSYSLGLVGILSMIASALLAVLIAFLVLVFRELLIILCAVIAPVAIVAYILPNTQKAGKLWWDFFSKALLAFPIISGLIAIGRVFAVVSQQAGTDGGNSGTVRGFIAFIAYFAPYFVLPQAFRMAGGAIGNISGLVNDRGRGAFDRLKNFRKQQSQKNWENTRSGNRFAGGTEANFRGRMNRRLEGVSRLNEAGLNPTRWGTKMRNAMSDATEAHLDDAVKNSNFALWSGDDEKLWAARGHSREEVERLLVQRDPGRFAGVANAAERDRAVEQIMTAKRQMGTEAFARARIRAQAKTGTGYQFEDENGNRYFDASAMLEDINEAYGDDRNGAGRALAEMRSSLANSGQIAGLAGYGTWASQMGAMYKAKTRSPGETDAQAEARYMRVRKSAHDRIMDDTINSVAPGQALYGKPTSAAAVGEAHARRIQAIADSINNGTPAIPDGSGGLRVATNDDLAAAVANAAGIYDAMAQASPNNANAMAEKLMGANLNLPPLQVQKTEEVLNPATGAPVVGPTGQPLTRTVTVTLPAKTVREYIQQQMAGNPEFADRRRDFSAATWEQAQRAGTFNPTAGGGGPGGGPGGGLPTGP